MATKQYTGYDIEDSPYESVSGSFNKRQQDRQGFGIQNVKTTGNTSTRRVSEKAIEYYGSGVTNVGKKLKEQARARELAGKDDLFTKGLGKVGERVNKMGRVAKASSRGFAFKSKEGVSLASARFQIGWTIGWTGFLCAVAAPIGMGAIAAFGATAIISSTMVGEILTEIAAWMLGSDAINVWVLAIGLFVLHTFLIITIFAGAYIQLKLGGLQPLHGRASGTKNLLFLGSFLASAFLPGTTVVPWICAWLLFLMLYPN